MPDFPIGLPDIANAAPSETLFTMHAGASHVTATNRILTNLVALATKLGVGASAPGATAGLLRRTGSGLSAWDLLRAGDIAAGSIFNGDVAATAAIAYAKLALGASIVNADIAAAAAIALSKLAPGAAGVLKSNGTTIVSNGQITTLDMVANAATNAPSVIGSTQDPETGSATSTTLPEMTLTTGNGTGAATTGVMLFSGMFRLTNTTVQLVLDLYVNNVFAGRREIFAQVANVFFPVAFHIPVAIPSAAVNFRIEWWVAGVVTCRSQAGYRTMTIQDFRR